MVTGSQVSKQRWIVELKYVELKLLKFFSLSTGRRGHSESGKDWRHAVGAALHWGGRSKKDSIETRGQG
jgi:hypothetical protein